MESGGLGLGCARAQLAGSLEAGPATHQRGKGKHRSEKPETVLLLPKAALRPRRDRPERSTAPGWGLGRCSAGQRWAGSTGKISRATWDRQESLLKAGHRSSLRWSCRRQQWSRSRRIHPPLFIWLFRSASSSIRLMSALQMVSSNHLSRVHSHGQSMVTSLRYPTCPVPSLLLPDLLLILLPEPWHCCCWQPQATLLCFSMLLSFALC